MYIRYKLGLGFGVMIVLIVASMVLSRYEMRTVAELDKMHDQLQNMQLIFTEVRRQEKNYLMRLEGGWAEQTLSNAERLSHMLQESNALVVHDEQAFRSNALDLLQEYRKEFIQLVNDRTLSAEKKRAEAERDLVPTARRLHTLLEKQVSISEKHLENHLTRTERVNAWVMVFAILGAVSMTFMLMRSILSSLEVGRRFVQGISSGALHTKMLEFPRDEIGLLLKAMQAMGLDLQRMEDANTRAMTSRLALSAILETSMEPLSLQRQLEVILQIVLTVPFLHVKNRGVIFMVDEADGSLHMTVSHGLDPNSLAACSVVPPGRCLCGRTAIEGRLLFSANGDARHETHYEGMIPHGHYTVPILSHGKVLGVITLYLDAEHHQDDEEESFLSSVAFTIAGVLERKRTEERIQHMAHHDPLTSLPNRALFAEHLAHALAMATRTKELFAVMLIDLDHFKQVNDTLGHAAGDHVLITATQRMRECLRASDLLARMGGDEFAIILADLPSPEAAGLVADKIVHSVSLPIDLAGESVLIGASIGIAIFPNHGQEAGALLANADKALYLVKERGRNTYSFYNEEPKIRA